MRGPTAVCGRESGMEGGLHAVHAKLDELSGNNFLDGEIDLRDGVIKAPTGMANTPAAEEDDDCR